MKRGEQFKRIFTLLSQGKTTQEVIEMGFPSSSVYWAWNKYKKGELPPEPKVGEPEWMAGYRAQGLTHDCADGRVGTIEVMEIMTDEGIIFQQMCNKCSDIISSLFSKWTPDSKERYLQWKVTGRSPYKLMAALSKGRYGQLGKML